MGFHEEAAKAFRSKAHPEGTDPERKVWEIRARVTIEVWLEGMGLPAYAIPEITFGSSIIAGRVYAGWTLEGYEYRAWVGDELEEVDSRYATTGTGCTARAYRTQKRRSVG